MLHIIYTHSDVLLSKHAHASWRDLQHASPDFKTSLGPWSEAAVVAFLAEEYPDLSPPAAAQVADFLQRPEEATKLIFVAD